MKLINFAENSRLILSILDSWNFLKQPFFDHQPLTLILSVSKHAKMTYISWAFIRLFRNAFLSYLFWAEGEEGKLEEHLIFVDSIEDAKENFTTGYWRQAISELITEFISDGRTNLLVATHSTVCTIDLADENLEVTYSTLYFFWQNDISTDNFVRPSVCLSV